MSVVNVKYRQSIFDITAENFGQLDNLITVSKDNNISISEALAVNSELIINNTGLGDENIKNTILVQGLTFNNSATFATVNRIFEDGANKVFENNDNNILE